MKNCTLRNASLAAIISTALLSGCGEQETQIEDKAPVIRPVKVFEVSKESFRTTWSYPATIEANQESNLSFETGGKITLLNVVEGQEVSKGDVIARTDDSRYKIQYRSARAQFDQASNAYNRAKKLATKNVLSKSQLEEIEFNYQSALASFDSAKKSLEDTVLVVPYSGLVSTVNFKKFDNIGSGSTLATIISKEIFTASFDISADSLSIIDSQKEIGTHVVFNNGSKEPIEATFQEVSLKPQGTSQSYEIKVSFKTPNDIIVLPGMSATVIIDTVDESKLDSISVPVSSIVSDAGKTFVWVVDPENLTLSKQNVTVTEGVGQMIEIKGDLSEGDIVVAGAAAYMADGMKVKVWDN
ncbi:efflux RND transporter periplasmic adaptor subunit [Photobacterium swingsii]|uniref:efflux RND transporter periplasmic adaptor subunit n=1 Tax=Photobacterium swingsii TaxID=680026 RepID=UPI004067B5FB